MLKIDVESLQSAVNYGVQGAVEKLQSAKSKAASISVPRGFSMADTVRRIPSQIESAIGSLLSAKNSVISTTNKFIGAEIANASLINSLFMGLLNIKTGGLFDLIQSSEKKNFNVFNLIKPSGYGYIGVNQGIFEYLKGEDRAYYDELVSKTAKKYNMGKKDVIDLMDVLDSIGACTYAAAANSIIKKYAYNSAEFEEKYGINLYRFYNNKANGKTEVRLNDAEILLDLFIAANTDPNVGKDTVEYKYNNNKGYVQKFLLERTKDNKLVFNEGALATVYTPDADNKYTSYLSIVDETLSLLMKHKNTESYHRSFLTSDIENAEPQIDFYQDIYDWHFSAGQGLKAWVDSHQEGKSSNVHSEYITPKVMENSELKVNDQEMNIVKQKIKDALDNGNCVNLGIHSEEIALRDKLGKENYVRKSCSSCN